MVPAPMTTRSARSLPMSDFLYGGASCAARTLGWARRAPLVLSAPWLPHLSLTSYVPEWSNNGSTRQPRRDHEMDFGLTDEQQLIVRTVRAFVERELYPL